MAGQLPRRLLRDQRRRALPARAGVPRRRHQGARDLARHPHDPGVPRGLRRRRLPVDQPVRRAQGRHGRLHDVRGRQPRAAAAGRQGAAHRLLQRVLGPRPVRHGPLRRRPGRRDRDRADQRPQAAGAGQGPAARRRRVGPGGRAARLRLPAGDAALPRGAHAGGGGAPAQARHRPEDEPGRGLLPGPGPRDRRGPRARRAAGPRGVRRQGPVRCRTATSRSPSTCCATCTRCPRSRPTGPGSWSTAG